MKLTFAGVGSAFSKINFQSNMVIEVGGKRLLIDAGGDIRWALDAINLGYRDFDAVYISHLHADHIGGMEWLAFCTYFDPTFKRKLKLIGNSTVLDKLWDSIKGGVRSIQGRLMTMEDYFEVIRIGPNGQFIFQDIAFQLVQMVHVMDGYEIVPFYGLIWEAPNGRRVFLTTDTQFCPKQIETFYDGCDVIFHDCETSPYPSGVHAHYKDLATLPVKHKSKMWLYHFNDGDKPEPHGDGFIGFVKDGQAFDLSAIEVIKNDATL